MAKHTASDKHKKAERFNKANQKAFLEAMVKRRGNIAAACKLADVSRSQVYIWRKEDPDFEQLFQETRVELTEFLFEKVCELGEMGDTTLLIFALKSLDRARFDDAYARQERAFEKGLQPQGDNLVPVRAILVRDEPPAMVNGAAKEQEH